MKISNSVLLLIFVVDLNRLPSTGYRPARDLVGRLRFGGIENTAEHYGLAVVDQHLSDDLPGVDRRHGAAVALCTSEPTESSDTSISRTTRLSGVINGVTLRDSTAFLN